MKEQLQEEFKQFLTINELTTNSISISFLANTEKAIIPQILFNVYNFVFLKTGWTGKIDVQNK